jgi:hypothetical protein
MTRGELLSYLEGAGLLEKGAVPTERQWQAILAKIRKLEPETKYVPTPYPVVPSRPWSPEPIYYKSPTSTGSLGETTHCA